MSHNIKISYETITVNSDLHIEAAHEKTELVDRKLEYL